MNKDDIPDINKRFLAVINAKGYSGYRLAKEVKEISQSKLTHIRSGRNQPSNELITALTKKFTDINNVWLLTGEGEMIRDYYNINTQTIKGDGFKNTNGNKITELPDGTLLMQVPLVPFNEYGSFLEVYGDGHQVNERFETTYFTVDKVARGRYIAFTLKNDSMNGGMLNDTPSGAQVLAIELEKQHWQNKLAPTQYGWIIICETGIFHKDVNGPDDKGNITCVSRNRSPEFPKFSLSLNEVHSIYKVVKRTF